MKVRYRAMPSEEKKHRETLGNHEDGGKVRVRREEGGAGRFVTSFGQEMVIERAKGGITSSLGFSKAKGKKKVRGGSANMRG